MRNSSLLQLHSLALVGLGLHVGDPSPSYHESYCFLFLFEELTHGSNLWVIYTDKVNRLDVGNAVNPWASDEDKKLVVVKSPNAVNPLVWDYIVSIPFFF